jgi:quercetin dioxygenase-like cupin family protein
MDGPVLHEWKNIEEKTIVPGFRARFIHSANMTFALWDIDAGASLPEHAHPHEQVVHLLEGELSLTVAGINKVMKTGSVAVIPSNARHFGKAVTTCRVLDVFYPVREDYFPNSLPTVFQDTKSVYTESPAVDDE